MGRRRQFETDMLRSVTLESDEGLRATFLNRGATIRSLVVPCASGPVDVVLSYCDDDDYLSDGYYLGTTVGPFANRIRGARFELDGEPFELDANERPAGHCLHGGSAGLHQCLFELHTDARGKRVECRTELAHGVGGFPGNRSVRVAYELLTPRALAIDFCVTTDRDTVVSLANHAYFNLGGPLEDHEIRLLADAFTPVHASKIPTGEIRPVADTSFDLRSSSELGERKFDHNFVLSGRRNEARPAAELRLASTGLHMNLYTPQPGLQLYTGDYLDAPFTPRQGLCLEAQGFPDAPNQPRFPSARLAAGSRYRQRTIYEFPELSD